MSEQSRSLPDSGPPYGSDDVDKRDNVPAVAGSVWSGNRGRLKATKVPPTTGPWRRSRRKHPRDIRLWNQPKAADFARDRGLSSVLQLIRAFRTLGADYDRMLAAEFPGQVEVNPYGEIVPSWVVPGETGMLPPQARRGRPCGPGRWELAAMAFVASGYRSVQSFCNRLSGTGIWRECGFGDWEPDDRTVRIHLERMEDTQWKSFAKVANALIAHAHSCESRIAEVTFGDATKWQSPALVKRVEPLTGTGRTWSTKNVLKRASEADFQSLHEKESAAPEAEDDVNSDDPEEVAWADERGNVIALESPETPIRSEPDRQYFVFNDVEYVALDPTAGLRKIVKQPGNRIDVWFGGYALSLVDGFTGLRLSTQVFRADEQEYDHIPVAIEEINDTLGRPPRVLSVDKFSSTKDMYEYCERRGIYLVGHYKGSQTKPDREHLRCDAFDEHQIPRCPHCGGESDILGTGLGHYWDSETEEPRIRGRCLNRDSDECRRDDTFSLPCMTEPRMLTGLPLTTQLWHAVAERHGTWEAIFGNDRDRSSFAGKDTTGMLSRRGVPAQRLRGEISRMLDWFRVCLRHGWIEGWENLNENEPIDLMADRVDRRGVTKYGIGKGRLARVMGARRIRGLNLPYGSVAERLGLVPPSVRASDVPDGGEPPPDA